MEGISRAQWRSKTSYDQFMLEEGVPIIEGWSVYDVALVERRQWRRLGGSGAFIQLYGQEDVTAMYVVEVPTRGALNVERHMYEETYYVMEGTGSTEVWDASGELHRFGWQRGALFAIPLNAPHRVVNEGEGPALLLAQTNAPMVMDLYHSPQFVFQCDFFFKDRFDGRKDYFQVTEDFVGPGDVRGPAGEERALYGYWATNLIPDVASAPFLKGSGGWKGGEFQIMGHELSDNAMTGHYSEFPSGQYNKAHAHGGGAVLLVIQGEGYTLMWPWRASMRPYESGNEEEVVRADWKPGSIFSPGSGWFHMHLATGHDTVRQLALRYGSKKWPVGFYRVAANAGGPNVSIREGGTVIDFDLEDPRIRADFKAELAAKGTSYRMPADQAP